MNATALHSLNLFLQTETEFLGYTGGAMTYVIHCENDNFQIHLADEVTVTTKSGSTVVNSFKEFCQLHQDWQEWY